MPRILLSGDSPSAPMNHEEDDNNQALNQVENPNQDWVNVSMTQQLDEAMEDSVTVEIQASCEEGEGCVENTTNPPKGVGMEEEGDPIRENTLKDTLKYIDVGGVWYGENVENTAISPVTLSDVRKGGGESEYTGFPSIMMGDIDKVTSPATSTPGSSPSPIRSRDEQLRDSELQDSEMSVIDSSVADIEKPEVVMQWDWLLDDL